MTISICFVFMMLAANAALAAESNPPPTDPFLWWAHLVVTVLGVLVAVRLAYQAFGKPPFKVAEAPTFPKYMTSRQHYWVGSFVYMLFAATFFLLLVSLHREVIPVARLFSEPVSKKIIDAVDTNSAPYLMTIIFIGAVYLYMLKKEAPWNVLLMMRDLIHGWISIPSLARDVVAQIQDELCIPDDAVAKVIRRWPGVGEQDFSKDKNTIDRKWAEVCYMRSWLEEKKASRSDATFFAEKTFKFNRLLVQFERVGEKVKEQKTDEGIEKTDPTGLADDLLKPLHKNFSRLVACYLIYRNGDRRRLIEEARKFGITLQGPMQENPLVYSIVYILTLMACVYVGVYLSAVLFDWAHNGNGLLDAIAHQDGAHIHSWIIYSAGNYGLTIILILSLRMGARAVGIGTDHLVTYCWTFLIALVTGPFVLAILAKYLHPVEPYRSMPPLELFYQMLVWGLGPALISVYITYYLDRQTSSDMAKIDHSLSTVGWRLVNSFCFGAGTVLLLLPSLLTIPPVDVVPWPAEKLRFVSTGATFLLSAGLALAAQFALRKRSQTRHDAEGGASTAAGLVN
jgi:hypothetical protein